MSGEEPAAVEAFERLGLTSYEAKVFIALHRLDTGTASDVARAADVPRSQVYGAAENLAERGLLEIQRSNPIRYRPIDVEEARAILRERFEREGDRAFEYVESVRGEAAGDEQREELWTVRGRERVEDRVLEVLARAEERVVFGTRLPDLLTEDVEDALAERAASGVDVVALSRDPEVRERLAAIEGVTVAAPPEAGDPDERSGRIVLVDDDGVLLSVVGDDGTETAFWSSGSTFATVLIELIGASTAVPLD